MSLLVLVAPPNVIGSYSDSRGNVAVLDATGRVQVNTAVFALAELLEAGFSLPADVAGAVRPAVTFAGQPFFDTTLASGAGKPIWRGAANDRWIDATGATV